jgi:predicted nucleic acid-binding protein
MPTLVDTNIFLRLVSRRDPLRPVVLHALHLLRTRREMLCYTPQVLAEFWNVCTRPPSARGGFGLSPADTESKARLIERYFHLLPDNLRTYQTWRHLIVRYGVSGVHVHDARLIASMTVYGLTHLLTFNTEDFRRYHGITVVTPHDMRPA